MSILNETNERSSIDAAIQRTGDFNAVRLFGDFAPDASFEHPEAWRMLYAMQRADRPRR